MGAEPDVWFPLAMTQLASRGVNTVGTGVNTVGTGVNTVGTRVNTLGEDAADHPHGGRSGPVGAPVGHHESH